MLDIHIIEFYTDVGKIFWRLYQNFPRKISIWVEDISGPDQPDEYGLHSDRYMATYNTMIWLMEEGYIRYQDVEQNEVFNHCCLTEKGYVLLVNIDDPTIEEERSINQISAALKEKSSTQMQSVVAKVIQKSYKR